MKPWRALLGRPTGGPRENQRTAGLLAHARIANAAFPDPEGPSGVRRWHAVNSRGGGHGTEKTYRVPFSPSLAEGPYGLGLPASRDVVKFGMAGPEGEPRPDAPSP